MNCPECNIELKKAEWDLIDCFVEFTFMQIIYSITLIPFLIITGVIGQVIFMIIIGYFVVTNWGKSHYKCNACGYTVSIKKKK